MLRRDEVARHAAPRHRPGRRRDPGEPDPRAGRHRRRRRAAGDVPVLVDNTFATPVLQNPLEHGARWRCTAPPSTSAATATWWAASSPAARSRRRAAPGARGDRRRCCTRSAPTCCTAAWRPCRCGCGPSRRRRASRRRVARRGTRGRRGALPRARRRHPRTGRRHADARARRDGLDHPARRVGAARAATSGVRLFTHAVSLGGVDSLIQHPAALTHRPVAAEAQARRGRSCGSRSGWRTRRPDRDLDRGLGRPRGCSTRVAALGASPPATAGAASPGSRRPAPGSTAARRRRTQNPCAPVARIRARRSSWVSPRASIGRAMSSRARMRPESVYPEHRAQARRRRRGSARRAT